MKPYQNLGGDSSVLAFDSGKDYIIVKFTGVSRDGANTYKYSYQSADQSKIEEMKKLAELGQGLGTYIQEYVRKDYEDKWFS